MTLSNLTPSWQKLRQDLLSRARVLLAVDDPAVRWQVRQAMSDEGFDVDCVATVAEAWDRVQTLRYDLMVADQDMRGQSGLELISLVRSAGIAVPSVLVVSSVSVSTISRALEHGAADVIRKPLDDLPTVVRRLWVLMDRRISTLVYDVIVRDFRALLQAGSLPEEESETIQQDLIAYRVDLGSRPHLLVATPPGDAGARVGAELSQRGLTSIASQDAATARAWYAGEVSPMAAIIDLDLAGALELVGDIHRADPVAEILVTTDRDAPEHALEAVAAGASDFAMPNSEGLAAVCGRAHRLVNRSRRRRLYLHLLATLYRAARRIDKPHAKDIFSLVPPDERALIRREPRAAGNAAANEFDIDQFTEDVIEMSGDIRSDQPLRFL